MAGVLFGAWPTAAGGGGAVGSNTSGTTPDVGTALSDTAKVGTTVVPQHRLGVPYVDRNGGLWVYQLNNTTALTIGDWVTINYIPSTGGMVKLATSDTNVGRGFVGVVGGTVAADDYGWVQVFGHNTHALIVGDTETTAAQTGRTLFVSATAGRATSDTIALDQIYGAFTSVASNTGDTGAGAGKYVGVDLQFPYYWGAGSNTALYKDA